MSAAVFMQRWWYSGLRLASFLYRGPRRRLLRIWTYVLLPFRMLTASYQRTRGIVRVEADVNRVSGAENIRLEKFGGLNSPPRCMPLHTGEDSFWKFNESSKPLPSMDVLHVKSGRTCGADGAVVSLQGTLLREYSGSYFAAPDTHPLMYKLWYPPVKKQEGVCVNLGVPKSANYYHWLFDVLPRLDVAWRAVTPEQIDYYLVDKRFAFQHESLTMLGVSKQRCVQLGRFSHYQCETMVVPSLRRGVSVESVHFLRNRFMQKASGDNSKSLRRLYISRRGCSRRRVRNEDAVCALLQAHGFDVIDPANLSFAEQIRIFQKADLIVGAHGGALSNLVFCPERAAVIELFSPNYVNVCFWRVACAVGMRYAYLLGEGDVPPDGVDPHIVHDHITIDLEKLERLVKQMLSAPAAD